MTVSAIIVTRGNVDLTGIRLYLERAGFTDDTAITWDNSIQTDLAVYGRYEAIKRTDAEFIYVQDDDCLVEPDKIRLLVDMAKAKPTEIVANMPISRWPDYPDSCLVGWGAAFHRGAPEFAFNRWARNMQSIAKNGDIDLLADFGPFHRECDVVFTTLTPHTKIDLGFQHLPWAEGPDRMFTGPDRDRRAEERARMLDLARQVRDA